VSAVVEASGSAGNKLTAEPGRIASIAARSWTTSVKIILEKKMQG
jgi:hypothetical protein